MRRASHCGDFSRRATKRSRHSVARFVGFSGIEEMFRKWRPALERRTGGRDEAAAVTHQRKGESGRSKSPSERFPVEERGAGGEAHYAQVLGDSAEANVDDADVKQENAEVKVESAEVKVENAE